jgi:hypothetical protein
MYEQYLVKQAAYRVKQAGYLDNVKDRAGLFARNEYSHLVNQSPDPEMLEATKHRLGIQQAAQHLRASGQHVTTNPALGIEKDAGGFGEFLGNLPGNIVTGAKQLWQGAGAVGEAGAQLGKDVAGTAASGLGGAAKSVLPTMGGQSAQLQQLASEAAKRKLIAQARAASAGIRANMPPRV